MHLLQCNKWNDFIIPRCQSHLLKYTLNPNDAHEHGRTSWHHSAEMGHVAPALLLLEGAEIDHLDSFGCTPLFIAAEERHFGPVRLFAEANATRDQADNNENIFGGCSGQCPFWRATPLYAAAVMGHLHIVRVLVEAGAAIDQAANHGLTPVLVAAANGHFDIVWDILT